MSRGRAGEYGSQKKGAKREHTHGREQMLRFAAKRGGGEDLVMCILYYDPAARRSFVNVVVW